MKRTENATNTLIIQAEKAKTKKKTPWRCTDKSCKVSFTCNLSGAILLSVLVLADRKSARRSIAKSGAAGVQPSNQRRVSHSFDIHNT